MLTCSKSKSVPGISILMAGDFLFCSESPQFHCQAREDIKLLWKPRPRRAVPQRSCRTSNIAFVSRQGLLDPHHQHRWTLVSSVPSVKPPPLPSRQRHADRGKMVRNAVTGILPDVAFGRTTILLALWPKRRCWRRQRDLGEAGKAGGVDKKIQSEPKKPPSRGEGRSRGRGLALPWAEPGSAAALC